MKMDVPLLETPQQVSIIGEAQIRDQAISSVAEAVRYSAGVRPMDYGITDDDVAVRGFYLTGTGLYRDGMRMVHNGFMTNLEPYGLERLEVVHGPASVLYGQSAPGGLINAVTSARAPACSAKWAWNSAATTGASSRPTSVAPSMNRARRWHG